MVIVKKGEEDIPGLTDTTVPRRLGPKRASRIRKLFNLSKEDDVRQYVVRKPLNKDGKKARTKAPKIQRLVTPRVLQHKRPRTALKKQRTKKNKDEAAEYAKLLAKRMKEAKEKRQEQIAKRRRLSSLRASTSKSAAKSLQSCPTLCDPIDGCPPGSTVPGTLHARTLEWVAISFSKSESSQK